MVSKIYNIPLSCAFVDVLAEYFLKEYQDKPLELADVLFLLPNRRSCKSLKDAFVRQQGLKPTLLPQIQTLFDNDSDELQITGFSLTQELKNIPPAISTTERLMIFTKIIMAKPADYGLEKMPAGQAVALARELCSLMDMVYNQQLSFEKLKDIVPDDYAVHWQEVLKFLAIITCYWPDILKEEGKIDVVQRQNKLLEAQIELWKKLNPTKRIVIAGTTATFPLMKELVKIVSSLDNGEVFLYGIDKYLSDDDWEQIDDVHPQFELKSLLDYLNINRFDVRDFVEAKFVERENLISEVMRPAVTSDKWRNLKSDMFGEKSVRGLKIVNCDDVRREAFTIAILMREILTYPDKTAALVTTDRVLARRVATELARWDIHVDDSAGVPLTLTHVGIFLRQILSVVGKFFDPIEVLALMKHPLFANGEKISDVRRNVRLFERDYLREQKENANDSVFEKLKTSMSEVISFYNESKVKLTDLIKAHLKVAEVLSSTEDKAGDKILWKGEAGETAARFMADLLDNAEILGYINPEEYSGWLDVLMSGIMVRSRYGMHPRLKILGPIEARLCQFDRVIIGEVNEGVWPQSVSVDPWMSRPMKKDFGLPLPEKSIGIQAHDFSALFCNNEVFITRAARVQGVPMVKSRWWMRIETVLTALGIDLKSLEKQDYDLWIDYLDRAQNFVPILPPEPRPEVKFRPRKLPATAIEDLMRDPYIIFAKYILGLYPLNDIKQELTYADYGTIVHEVLKKFNDEYNAEYPSDAYNKLVKLGQEEFDKNNISPEQKSFWWPNFLKIADWIVNKEQEYRKTISHVYNEIKGQYEFDAPAGKFTLTAKADRVDITKTGKVNIIDYKTGQARKTKEIQHSYAPQLPIEAIIAEHGGFPDIAAKEAEALIYWKLGKEETGIFENTQEVVDNTEERIKKLISLFDFETTAYVTCPNPKYAPKYSDYERLSRIREITFGEEN